MPRSCSECKFKMNHDKRVWRCGLTLSFNDNPHYISAWCDPEKERPKWCPIIKEVEE